MTNIEEYNINYELFLAENEMIESLLSITPLINESVGLIIINESVKDIILKYLTRVSEQLTNVWEKFKKIFFSTKDKAYLKMISKKIENAEGGFTITNFPNYNMDKIDTIKIVPFNYEQMKDSLSNKSEFLKKFYPMINNNDGESIKESIKNSVIQSTQDIRCDNAHIKSMYDFCWDGYDNKINSIENDLKNVNESNRNIERIISTVQNTSESYLLIESFIFTEDNKDDKKVEFKDDPDKKEKERSDALLKDVTNFTKISTEICTAKMNIVKDCYNLYMKILRHAIKDTKDNPKIDIENNQQRKEIDTQVDL